MMLAKVDGRKYAEFFVWMPAENVEKRHLPN